MAAEVENFYEQYPYPRPIDSLDNDQRLWQSRDRRRADYHLFWPGIPYREDLSILVAGCGTSQAARYALRRTAATVTGIDFSATSIRHTEELKRKYTLENLEIRQLPIERANELGTTFDHIVCTGVLHHLEDPDAGLSALRGVLKPDGTMYLRVHAPYGRTGVYMLQEFCRRVGVRATDGDIRSLVTALGVLPPGHPLANLLRESPDFRSEAALADAVLHPQDRAYSVPQLFDFLARGGLTFGRWMQQAPYSAGCGVMADIPQASKIAELPLPEQFAVAELFRGTMTHHSAVVYRSDNPDRSQRVRFDGNAWLGYVPIRVSDTVCVTERLPPGAAGLLINQTHTHADLIAPIDPMEKRLFDAIDGRHSVADIVDTLGKASEERMRPHAARAFFERAWSYDHIVFDASKGRAA